MKYHINAYDIDYCVEAQDLDYLWPENQDWDDDDYDKKIAEIKSKLPSRMSFDIDCDDVNDLEDLVCDYITEKSGWLINGFNYRYKKVPVQLKDHFGRVVNPGDKVVLLYKAYGFRGIDRAYLIDVIYKGKGRWGYEFDWKNRQSYQSLIRMRDPECIKSIKKGGD